MSFTVFVFPYLFFLKRQSVWGGEVNQELRSEYVTSINLLNTVIEALTSLSFNMAKIDSL